MMDWCCDLETEDLIVPRDEPFSMFQSPTTNYWSNNLGIMDEGRSDEFGWTTNYNSTVTTTSSDNYYHHHHPLDEKLQQKLLFPRARDLDDNNREVTCSSQNSDVSTSSRFGPGGFYSLMPLDSSSLNMQSFSPGVSTSTGEGEQVHPPISPNNTMCPQHHEPPAQALGPKPLHPTKEISPSGGHIANDTVLEDMVLRELVMVLSQLPEKTRLCFRDSFYRLANKFSQEMPINGQLN